MTSEIPEEKSQQTEPQEDVPAEETAPPATPPHESVEVAPSPEENLQKNEPTDEHTSVDVLPLVLPSLNALSNLDKIEVYKFLENVDELEQSFKQTMQQISQDRTVDTFRIQYELIHKDLMDVRNKNMLLLEMIREKNEDVQKSATKIESMLEMTKSDKETIITLRQRFDRAWKVNELMQEKEVRNKETIEDLKGEIKTLTQTVQSANSRVDSEQQVIEEITQIVRTLRKEIRTNEAQMENLSSDLSQGTRETETMKKEIENFNKEYQDLNITIEKTRDKMHEEHDNILKVHTDMEEVNAEIEKGVNVINEKKGLKKVKREEIQMLERDKAEEHRQIKAQGDKRNQMKLKMKPKKSELKRKLESNEKLSSNIASYDFTERDSEIAELTKKFKVVEKEYNENTDLVNELKESQKKSKLAKTELQQKITKMNNDIFRMNSELNRKKSTNDSEQRVYDKESGNLTKLEEERDEEVKEFETTESHVFNLEQQLLNLKSIAHQERRRMNLMELEIQAAQQEFYIVKANTAVEKNIKKSYEEQISLKNEDLKKVEIKIVDLGRQIEDLRNERTKNKKKLQDLWIEQNEMRTENAKAETEISNFKKNIREKDQQCVKLHQLRTQADAESEFIEKENARYNEMIKECEEQILLKKNIISRLRFLLDQADMENKKQSQVAHDVEQKNHAIFHQIEKGSTQSELLKEQSVLLEVTMQTCFQAYKNQEKVLKQLEKQLHQEVQRGINLKTDSSHCVSLKKEEIRTTKELIMTQAHVTALQEELSRPRYIHRWRFLEIGDDELYYAIRSTQELRQHLIIAFAKINELKERKSQLEKRNNRMSKRTIIRNIDEQINELASMNAERNVQIKNFLDMISDRQPMLGDRKEKVTEMRDMVKDARNEVNEQYWKLMQFSSQRKFPTIVHFPGTKFMGGGFATTTSNSSKVLPSVSRNVIGLPPIVQPRTKGLSVSLAPVSRTIASN